MNARYSKYSAGFTLVEIVVTLVVVAVMFLAISGYVELGVRGYVDSVDRQKLQNQARFTIEKMTREIRHAVPNSFEVENNNHCLSFYPIKYSGFYVEDEFDRNLRFVVGQDDISFPHTFSSEFLVINPSHPVDLATSSIQSIGLNGVSGAVANPFFTVSASIESRSVASRHFIYEPQQQVTYCIESNNIITRQQGTTSEVIISDSVDFTASEFQYEQATLQRGGLVHLGLLFSANGESSQYKHDVQVLNVP